MVTTVTLVGAAGLVLGGLILGVVLGTGLCVLGACVGLKIYNWVMRDPR